ncbi:uncharacterized protein LOC141902428 isoform X2 [Tubulanus polymorphus]|uniref:uncharacterized protein LOC141902428 isoform X2 n=1 Tax=Tubulanus polymorphus TaxID=672921 RepID=UPI003DA24240
MNTDFQSEFLNFRYIQAVTSSGEECGDWRISDEKLSRRCSSTVGRPTPSMYAGSKAVRKRARDEDTASNTSASGSVSSTDSSSVCPGTSYAMPANSRSRRSSSLPAPMLAERPKRQIVPKSPENSVTGLSWREETQLKKALYASLNESKLQRSLSKEIKESESGDLSESSQSAADKRSLQINGSKISEGSFCQDKNSLKPNSSNRSKVRAQRKFAEGSRPNSPCVTPVKLKDPLGSPTMLSTMSHGDIPPTKRLQKTEDFLTFLCIRKNPFLPPQFEVFKQPTVIEHIPPYRSSSSRLHLLNRGSHKRDDLGVRPLSYGRSRRAEPKKRNKIIANQDSDNPIKRPRGRPVGSKSGPKVQTGVVAATKLAKAARQTMMRKSQAKASQKASSKSVKKPVKISQRQQQMRKRLRQRLVRKLRPRRSRVPIEALMMSDQDDDDYFEDFEHLIDVIPAAVVRTDGDVVEADISSGEELDDVDDDDDDDDDDDVDEASKPRSLRSTTVAVRNSFSSPRKINHDNNRCRSSSRLISSYRDTDSESLHSISDSVTSSTRSTRSMCTAGMTPSPLKTKSFYAEKRKLSPVVPLKVNIPSGRRNDGSKSARAGWTSCGSASNGGSPSTSRDSTPISRSVQSQRKRALDDIDGLPNIISNLDQILADVPKRVQNSDRVSSKTANRPLKRSRGRPSKSDADDWTSPAKKKAKRSRGSVKESHSGQSSYSGVGCATGGSGSRVIQCPVYKPTELEFKDPILYISSIKEEASHYGICRIIPPESWKPDCKVHDEMRFISQMQYIHMLREKWGPSLQKLECIKKHLHSQGLDLETLPVIGGVELDLPRLSSVIQGLGGLRNVPDKKRWGKVADLLGISKLALDRTTKLYDAYCRYLLSYDTLSDADKQKLEDSVLEDWKSGEMPTPDNIVRGRSNSLSGFYRAARNTFAMWFKDVETSTDQIENEYWNVIDDRQHHVAIQYGHVDTKTSGSGFPSRKENPYCKHPWNLNVLAMNNGSLLRNLGSVSGVTVPTLHIGMLFSTKCWSRDNHMLPYINYLHTGADTIWYSIVKGQVGKFKQLMADLFPDRLHDHPITSKNGAVMVSPDVLIEGGVNVCRTVQRQREFVVVFPETYCASVCCGYNISESVHYATTDYLPLGTCAAKELADASEAEKFSMDKLLYVLAKSEKTSNIILQSVLPHLESAIEDELSLRQQLREAGLKNSDQMVMLDENVYAYAKKRKNLEFMEEEDNVCKISRKICFFSMVVNVVEDKVYSLPHALQHILKKKNLRACKLMYRHSEEDLLNLITSVKDRLKVPQTKRKTAKKSSNTPR